jgi:zinc ribbon protein
MRPCPVCGALVSPTDDFCANCGTYLGWGQRRADDEPTVELPAVDQPAVEQPAPVQPATPIAPRPARETGLPEPKIDGPPCPNCGTPNLPGRRFCRRCAYPLTAPEQTTGAPSRRRFRRLGGSGRLTRALILLGLVLVLVIAGFALRPQIGWLVQDVLDKTSQPASVHPVTETASAEVPGHPASAAVDGFSNRYWAVPGPGTDAWIEFEFDHPFRLLSFTVTTGASTSPREFAAQGRATQFDVLVTASDGTVTTVSAPLMDQPGPQTVQAGISDVVRIRMVIHAASGVQPGGVAALGEVEFFARS